MIKHLLFCILISAIATGQKIYFPKEYLKDSISRQATIPQLAEQLIPLYKEENKETYYDNLFRLQFVTKKYPQMISSLNKLCQEMIGDSINPVLPGSGYRILVKTLQSQPKDRIQFEEAYFNNAKEYYHSLYPANRVYLSDYLIHDINKYKSDYETVLADIATKDSLTINEAVYLCRKYGSFLSASFTNKVSARAFKRIEAEVYNVKETVIPMSDGGTIAVTIVRSQQDTTPKPVVLMYNIYAGNDVSKAKNINFNGFTGVIANTRGKGRSKDSIAPFEHDAKDAYEIIDWISQQEWCNGKIGMYGGSYLGFSQWSAVKKIHPALKTIVPQVAVGAGIDFPMHNGIFSTYALRWIHYVTGNKTTDYDDFNNEEKWNAWQNDYFKKGFRLRDYDKEIGRPSAVFQKWLQHPTYDSFWQQMTPQKEEFAQLNIPILSITGYYDDDQIGAMHYFKEHQKWNPNNNHFLVIGPFDHYGAQGFPNEVLNGYTLDERAVLEIEALVFDWFNYVLNGARKPGILSNKVNFQVMGKNKWEHASGLDQMHNSQLTFYLSDKQLVLEKPKQNTAIQQVIDFKDRRDNKVNPATDVADFSSIVKDNLTLPNHYLTFESEALTETMVLSGSLIANLKLSCNKKDMDVVFLLYEKTPDGKYFALTSDYHRLSQSKDHSKRQLLRPNTIESFSLSNNYITCKQLQKGSQIVIVMGVLKNGNWQINYGTGRDVSDESILDATVPLEVKWYSDSNFIVPILRD
jgi:uncharacterized protein